MMTKCFYVKFFILLLFSLFSRAVTANENVPEVHHMVFVESGNILVGYLVEGDDEHNFIRCYTREKLRVSIDSVHERNGPCEQTPSGIHHAFVQNIGGGSFRISVFGQEPVSVLLADLPANLAQQLGDLPEKKIGLISLNEEIVNLKSIEEGLLNYDDLSDFHVLQSPVQEQNFR